MTSVWLVERGEYSDYRVEAIFSTKEQADACASQMKGSYGRGNAQVREWVLNEWTPDKTEWEFSFSLDGEIVEESVDAYVEVDTDQPDVYGYRHEKGVIEVTVNHGPREAALKIASERYLKIRAFLDEADERTARADYRRINKECSFSDALEVAEILAGLLPVPPNPPQCTHHKNILTILGIPEVTE